MDSGKPDEPLTGNLTGADPGRWFRLRLAWWSKAWALVLVLVIALFSALSLSAQGEVLSVSAQVDIDGEVVYQQRCAFCHGDQGDGNGPVARYLNPRPRDFTAGQFKFRTTASGELPLRQDVIDIVKSGVRSTAMPRWDGVLSDAEIEAVVDYVTQSFVPFWGTYDPPVIEIPNPPRVTNSMIEQGEQLYQELQCWKCHGDVGRADGGSALTLTDDSNQPIRPADLTKAWRYKGGSDLVDIYTRFSTGLDGSPMPSFYDVIGDDERYALAAYVQSLHSGEPTDKSVVVAEFVDGELPGAVDDTRWETVEPTSFYLTGQVIVGPRWQTPGVDAVTARALYNPTDLAILIEWNDATEDATSGGPEQEQVGQTYIDLETFLGAGPYADGLAVQFPASMPEGVAKPYFAWGQPGKPVNVWLWRAAEGAQEFNGTGLQGGLTAQAESNVEAQFDYAEGHYRLLLIRSLNTGDPEDIELRPGEFIPIAFQAWEGSNGEAGTRMALSSWYSLLLEESTSTSAVLYAALAAVVVVAGEVVLMRRLRS